MFHTTVKSIVCILDISIVVGQEVLKQTLSYWITLGNIKMKDGYAYLIQIISYSTVDFELVRYTFSH
jgi:hypothetical protein